MKGVHRQTRFVRASPAARARHGKGSGHGQTLNLASSLHAATPSQTHRNPLCEIARCGPEWSDGGEAASPRDPGRALSVKAAAPYGVGHLRSALTPYSVASTQYGLPAAKAQHASGAPVRVSERGLPDHEWLRLWLAGCG
ncbi:hypothetical protein VTN02DRAFT_1780 [Thermoascus thermophilus]